MYILARGRRPFIYYIIPVPQNAIETIIYDIYMRLAAGYRFASESNEKK